MSLHYCLLEDAKQDLRQVEKEMQRQMKLLALHLQQLDEELSASCPCSTPMHPFCLCQPNQERRALTTPKKSLGSKVCFFCCICDIGIFSGIFSPNSSFCLSSLVRLNRLLNFSHDNKLLALVDMKGFDPKEIIVTEKDGKVKVLAEHKEEHSTVEGKEYNYRSIMKETSLLLGVSKDEVTYSLGPNSIMKIERTCKCYPCLLSPLQGDCTCCPGLSTWACTSVGSGISFHCRKARKYTL
uniref:Outer dense fiber protein 1 n=1 Tax=Otus sunia TaxID=257818 RepID=A0A8C8AKP3_9STRI